MLAQSLWSTTRRVSLCRSLLHRQLNHLASPDTEPPSSIPLSEKRGGYIKLSDPIQNTLEAFAILREVERKFGKLYEFQFYRDGQLPEHYSMRCSVIFQDPEALKRIPQNGFEFRVALPPAPSSKSGGPGLEEFKNYARSEEYDEGYQPIPAGVKDGKNEKTVLVRVEPRGYHVWSQPYQVRYPHAPRMQDSMIAFLKWGGFSKLEPLESSTRIKTNDWFSNNPPVDHIRMRAALQFCADKVNFPNPGLIQPKRVKPEPRPLEVPVELEPLVSGRKRFKPPKIPQSPDTVHSDAKTSSVHTSEAPLLLPSEPDLTHPLSTESQTQAGPLSPTWTPPAPSQPTPEELAAQKESKILLERQMNLAKQLRQARQKAQPKKLPVKKVRAKKDPSAAEDVFEYPPEPPQETGVIGRLMSLFRS